MERVVSIGVSGKELLPSLLYVFSTFSDPYQCKNYHPPQGRGGLGCPFVTFPPILRSLLLRPLLQFNVFVMHTSPKAQGIDSYLCHVFSTFGDPDQ